jgi:hypothetical protein
MATMVQTGARRAAGAAGSWVESLGRVGYAAKGIVYGLVGVLAVQVAVGAGGSIGGEQNALQRIASAPFGKILLAAVGVGLLGYALWRAVQAALDPEHVGTDAKGIGTRVGYAVSALLHTALAVSALRMAIGSSGGGGGDAAPGLTARLMSQPFGQWLVGLMGVVILAVAVMQFGRARTASFMKKMKTNEMSPQTRTWVERIGRAGYAARSVVFSITGIFVIVAAYQASPGQARGLGGALATLAQQPFGPILLGLVALGVVAYGLYAIAEARYRRMVVRV